MRVLVGWMERQIGRRGILEIDHNGVEPSPHGVLIVRHHRPVVPHLVRESDRALRRHDDRRGHRAIREWATGAELRGEQRVDRRTGRHTNGTCADGGRHEQMRRFGDECGCAAVLDGFPREPMPADAQAIADFEDAAEIDGESAARGVQMPIREVGARRNAEHPECGPGRQPRCREERGEGGRHQL